MRPEERDAAYLWDMLDAARNVRDFMSGLTFYNYDRDKKVKYAVERSLEIIGEAASKVSNEFRVAHPEISWKAIKGLRNVLVHEYGEIKHERIWIVATERIPELIKLLEPLIPPAPKPENE